MRPPPPAQSCRRRKLAAIAGPTSGSRNQTAATDHAPEPLRQPEAVAGARLAVRAEAPVLTEHKAR
jgi:hypothetical protein